MASSHLRPGRVAETSAHAPNAALLIDFDNVTLGVRSDLTKELRTLLNSDIIRGKVAVQRAYADWRRYVQYVMPLTERSIDLIFAPAMGSTKKNATDIRLAIDAMELVFTRPEIGTFILLSGDSDFSSLVVKLKEYGKYVIGVGIRESASDLLIQNCDEYFSYSELAGLTKESDAPTAQRDPWELVKEAVAQMARNRDVMRSDRLKQVMQQIDPNFDEGTFGFSRFSKFVTEAGTKNLLKVTKLENGQYDVAPLDAPVAVVAAPAASSGSAAPAAPREDGERREGGARRGRRRGRGGRERADAPRSEGAPTTTAPEPREPREPRVSASIAAPVSAAAESGLTLAAAFAMLTEAMRGMQAPIPHEALRLRMASMHGREDPMLEPTRFERFLRQANDAEICDVRKLGEHEFEVMPYKHEEMRSRGVLQPSSGESSTNGNGQSSEPAAPLSLRFRRGSRGPTRPNEMLLVGMVKAPGAAEVAAPVAAAAAPVIETAPVAIQEELIVADEPVTAEPAAKRNRRGGRRVQAAKAAKAAPVAVAAAAPAAPPKRAPAAKAAPVAKADAPPKTAKKKAAPRATKKKAE